MTDTLPHASARPWLALCAAAAVLTVIAGLAGNPVSWRWLAARGWADPLTWTSLWTAACVHLSAAHAVANLLALAALALLGYATGAGRAAALAWLLCWPLVTASLALWPSVKSYAGLSGLIHAGVGVVMAHTAVFAIAKPVAFVLGCGLALKLLTERAWQTPIAFSPDWGFNVVYGAHLSGTLLGLGAGSLGALGAVLTRAKRQ